MVEPSRRTIRAAEDAEGLIKSSTHLTQNFAVTRAPHAHTARESGRGSSTDGAQVAAHYWRRAAASTRACADVASGRSAARSGTGKAPLTPSSDPGGARTEGSVDGGLEHRARCALQLGRVGVWRGPRDVGLMRSAGGGPQRTAPASARPTLEAPRFALVAKQVPLLASVGRELVPP